VIIHQTLYSLFPPSSFVPTLITPLTPTEFIQRILVPEAAVGLIIEDRELDPDNRKHREKAVKILRESAAYGVAMFPDADTNIGGSGKGKGNGDNEDWDMGVGDEIVRERARARRKELEAEERAEEMFVRNEMERSKRERGGKTSKKLGENKPIAKQKEKAKVREVVEISESSDAGRRRPRPRKVQRETSAVKMDDIQLSSDASERTKGKRTTARKNDISKTRDTADIDLCSSTSDDTSRSESRRTKGKTTEREASIESTELVYPPSDEMSVDGLDAMAGALSDASSAARRKRTNNGNKNSRESDSDELKLLYPGESPKTKALKPSNSIVSLLSEDEDETPRPKKAPAKFDAGRTKAPLSYTSSTTSSNSKSSFPLQIVRDRRSER
jgi:hypothetical protein